MMRLLRRVAIAVLLALPGIGLAMAAMSLFHDAGALLLGVVLAFAVPVWWLARERSPRSP